MKKSTKLILLFSLILFIILIVIILASNPPLQKITLFPLITLIRLKNLLKLLLPSPLLYLLSYPQQHPPFQIQLPAMLLMSQPLMKTTLLNLFKNNLPLKNQLNPLQLPLQLHLHLQLQLQNKLNET